MGIFPLLFDSSSFITSHLEPVVALRFCLCTLFTDRPSIPQGEKYFHKNIHEKIQGIN